MRLLPHVCVAVTLFVASPALASYGSKPDLPTPAGGAPRDEGTALTPRQQAETDYRDAYDDVTRGSDALARGDAKNAQKRFRHALDRSRRAVETDSTYSEAWNLVGFTSRMLGDYPHSFEAYRIALRQKPDFGLAREYYGEGLLETGDLAGAREQLRWLQRIGDDALTAELQGAIDKYVAAHGDSSAAGSPKP